MSKSKQESFFWTSYSDLMTTLFFVMLVLFVLVILLLGKKVAAEADFRHKNEKMLNEILVKKKDYEKLEEINNSIKSIDPNYFEYNEQSKRFTLKKPQKVSFRIGSDDLMEVPEAERNELIMAGKAIERFTANAHNKTGAEYYIIIEGQASKDNYWLNDILSYRRALSLMNFWEDQEVLERNGAAYEVLISGSGDKSSFRDECEENNQRFVIYIIPKPESWATN